MVEMSLIYALCYLIGSIPFGFLLCKLFGLGDIRDIGSGNIGATNVLRTGNKQVAALTLFLDMFKGALAVWIAGMYREFDWYLWAAGLCTVLGHVFPVWLKFKGGKGVATAMGVALGLNPVIGVAMIVVWAGVCAWRKTSSIAALAAFLVLPGFALFLHGFSVVPFAMLISAIVYFRHYENILRIINNEEPQIDFSKLTGGGK